MNIKGNCLLLILISLILTIPIACEKVTDTGTIKGTVSDDSQPASGVYVLLLDSGKLLKQDQPLNNGSITNYNGHYTIYLVEPEKYYYVVAVKDNNGDLRFTFGVDEFGYYGNWNGIKWIPTEVKVEKGQVLEGIDIDDLI
jgi:hypothetical protein